MFDDGKTVQTVTDELVEDYSSIMGDSVEEPLFWYVLADTQWDFGVLLPCVKERALHWIDVDNGAFVCQLTGTSEDANRRKILNDLCQKLLSPQPPIKKVRGARGYKCQWQFGDVFAYRLESELARERGLYGRYFLIQKVDERLWYPENIVPIVYIKITSDATLPTNIEEYNRLEYVQTWFTKYEERFFQSI